MQLAHLGNSTLEDLENNDNTRIQSAESGGFKGAWRSMKSQSSLHSPVFRHAVRMALIASSCCLLIELIAKEHIQDNDLSLGYWILLTAVFVCQPNYSATKKRLIQRILGTVAGVLVGSALPTFNLNLETELAIAAVSVTLFFLFRTNKHSFSTFFITIQAIMGFSIMGMDVTGFFIPRVLDTLSGCLIAGCAVYFLWPDWKYLSLDKTAAAAISSNAGYLTAVLHELHDRVSHDKAAALSSTLSDMSGEPEKHGSRLADGFQLLKINYSIISYISALGAYRNKIQQDTPQAQEFLAQFYPAAEQAARILQHAASWQEEEFVEREWKDLQSRLENLRQKADCDTQSQVLWQQLVMLADLLQPCYRALHPSNIITNSNS